MEYTPTVSNLPIYRRSIVLAIRSIHADKIYNHTKKFELRKVAPKFIPRRMYLYESDKKSITGVVIVDKLISSSPEKLWEHVGELTATTKERFFDYYEGKLLGHAFKIAKATKFAEPLSLKRIKQIEDGFTVPRSFLYTDNFPKLDRFLFNLCLTSTLFQKSRKWEFKTLAPQNENSFITLVEKHISNSYLETGVAYAQRLIELSRLQSDPEGIFTYSKLILEIYFKNRLIGFATLTLKYSGAVKTGPVIILEKYRNQGLGKEFRQILHERLEKAGFTKVYCTAPVNNLPALNYLLASSYRIEAHLFRQYHNEHDEIVFGYLLSKQRALGPEIIRPLVPFNKFSVLNRFSFEVLDLMKNEFNNLYFQMPDTWYRDQLFRSLKYAASSNSATDFKPRLIFIASSAGDGGDENIQSVAFCVFKRGGSVKLLLFSRSSHVDSLIKFINFVEENIKAYKGPNTIRKIYSLVPSADVDIIEAFMSSGYHLEGILEKPFNLFSDSTVVAKQISPE